MAATYVFAAVGTLVILKLLALVMPLRAHEDIEMQGLDILEYREEAYGQEIDFSTATARSAAH